MAATPDPIFSDPRLAATYDVFEGNREDLDHYERIVREFEASVVMDVGCGTGELACRLARAGVTVIGVDPAVASVEIARTKPGADSVTWIVGTAEGVAADLVPTASVDLATMTGNVAQVFVDDHDWNSTVTAIASMLRPGGVFVFETRDPARRAWERWTPEHTRTSADLANGDRAETQCAVTSIELPLITFRYRTTFRSDGAELVSDSTLRFRSPAELDASLVRAGFEVIEVRDAPDRPGAEWVYVARRH